MGFKYSKSTCSSYWIYMLWLCGAGQVRTTRGTSVGHRASLWSHTGDTGRGQPPEGGAVVSSAVAVLLSSAVMQCCHNVCRNRFMVTLITNHDLWWLSSGDFCANFVLWPVFSLLSTKRDKGWHDNNYCRSHLPNIIGFSSI